MDGEGYLHPEGPALDSAPYRLPTSPLMHSSLEDQMYPGSSWGVPRSSSAYNFHYSMQSSNQQYHSTGFRSETYNTSLFQDTSELSGLGFSRNIDFAQDFSIDDLSNTSLFSSPPDSLSEYADAQSFVNSDGLTQVPTIWDVSTPTQSHREQNASRFHGLNTLEEIAAIIKNQPLAGYQIPTVQQRQPEEEEDADEEETEELGHADTYAEYKPSKSTIGISHPDIVVETNTLSSVPPPDITYTLSVPETTVKRGLLSALQLEAIIYACQQHQVILQNGQRAGFLIGDGAGVGKGRTVAGVILENYLKGRRKALWFSVSNDLKYDAERDLRDIDASNIPVHALNKIKYGDTTTSEGVLFATYSALIGESQAVDSIGPG
ncbi:hypothetical protein GJAV_G00110210 [Gymnothorax javanicus]|nr:hypothetical protein GJAV_G00110210 [Gymnothorax javanicus]